ncbi:hypothetical protein RHMOL_Rhmol04G0034000 [Rhododendron molle]|uniref:Uncharacterized protein n=1 Tax=Rhododendron molle TaxID=49168 RepID=A0ACC0NXZ0_RHOML|nr:hypothetical protein RHMOL_Rhmol04G0034000 [Rhododendron molle]
MGILDELRLNAVKLFNRNVSNMPPDTNGNRYSCDMGFAKAVTQTGDAVRSSGAEKLKEYVPDPDRREKIGRIISGIGKFAVESAVNESLKGVTGKVVVAMVLVVFPSQADRVLVHVAQAQLSQPKIFETHSGLQHSSLVECGFGTVSVKLLEGGIQVYKIVKEGSKDQPLPPNPNENKKPELTAVMEEMQARMEKMQEEMNTIKQQSKISMESAKGSEPLKEFPDEPIKRSALLKTDPKRVFIRSRL